MQPKSETLRVLMIAFSPVVREGLQAVVTKEEKIEVIGDASNEHEALQRIKRARDRGRPVTVVLTETRNGKVDGVLATRLSKSEFPAPKVTRLGNQPIPYVVPRSPNRKPQR